MAAPFLGGDEEEDEIIDDWSVTPSSIANIRKMARARDPSLAFLPPVRICDVRILWIKGWWNRWLS